MEFDKRKLGLLAGLGQHDDRYVIIEGEDKECKCKCDKDCEKDCDCDGKGCKCGQVPPGFSERKIEVAEDVLDEMSKDEIDEIITKALMAKR